MNTNNNHNLSFKAQLPVRCFIKNPQNNEIRRVLDNKEIRKHTRAVVTALNTPTKTKRHQHLSEFLAKFDIDYAKDTFTRGNYNPPQTFTTRSFPEYGEIKYPVIVTGNHARKIENIGSNISIANLNEAQSGTYGGTFSQEAKALYHLDCNTYLQYYVPHLKNQYGKKLVLNVLFEPTLKRDGTPKKYSIIDCKMTTY